MIGMSRVDAAHPRFTSAPNWSVLLAPQQSPPSVYEPNDALATSHIALRLQLHDPSVLPAAALLSCVFQIAPIAVQWRLTPVYRCWPYSNRRQSSPAIFPVIQRIRSLIPPLYAPSEIACSWAIVLRDRIRDKDKNPSFSAKQSQDLAFGVDGSPNIWFPSASQARKAHHGHLGCAHRPAKNSTTRTPMRNASRLNPGKGSKRRAPL
jgi:hypothetical protein